MLLSRSSTASKAAAIRLTPAVPEDLPEPPLAPVEDADDKEEEDDKVDEKETSKQQRLSIGSQDSDRSDSTKIPSDDGSFGDEVPEENKRVYLGRTSGYDKAEMLLEQCSSGAASEGVALMKPSDSEADKAFASGAPRKPAQLSASFWLPELRNQISSYLDVPALCAQRATARENYSPKAFVAHLVQLVRPETPDAIVAAADIVYNKEKLPARECAQVFARDRFQLFARFRGLMCIFDAGAPAFRLWWASNPGAITHLLTCWIEHNNSLDAKGQTVVLGASLNVFDDLDWGALRLKQMFAAEIIRLETESHHPSVQKNVSIILHRFPEIRSLACAASAPDTRAGALRKPPIWT